MHAGRSLGISYSQGSWDDKHLQLRGWDLTALSLRGLGDEPNRSGWPSQSKSIKRRVSVGMDPHRVCQSSCDCPQSTKDSNKRDLRSVDIYTHVWILLQDTLRHLHTFYIIFQCVTWRTCTAVSTVHVCHVAQLGMKSLGPSNVLVDYKSAYKLYHRQITHFLKLEV